MRLRAGAALRTPATPRPSAPPAPCAAALPRRLRPRQQRRPLSSAAGGSAAAAGLAERARGAGLDNVNVFAAFTGLANDTGAINLGQGFPSFGSPQFLLDAACDAILAGHNQYTRPGGHPQLVSTLARVYSERFGRALDPMSEVVTCNGAQVRSLTPPPHPHHTSPALLMLLLLLRAGGDLRCGGDVLRGGG